MLQRVIKKISLRIMKMMMMMPPLNSLTFRLAHKKQERGPKGRKN